MTLWCKYTLGRTKGLSDLLLCGDLNDSFIFVGYSTPQAQLAAPWGFCASLWGLVACCLPSLTLQHSGERFKCDSVAFPWTVGTSLYEWHTRCWEWCIFASFSISLPPWPFILVLSPYQPISWSKVQSDKFSPDCHILAYALRAKYAFSAGSQRLSPDTQTHRHISQWQLCPSIEGQLDVRMYLLVIRMAIFSLLSHTLFYFIYLFYYFANGNCYTVYSVELKGLQNLDSFDKLFDMYTIQFKGLEKARSV